jgi:hypothetical protein
MNSKRVYFVMLGIIVLLIAALLGGSYGIDTLLQKQSKKLVGLKLESQTLDQEQTSLTKAKQDVQKYGDLEKIAKSIVPQDKDQAEAVRQIVNIAAANGVALTTITFPASNLGSGIPPAAAATGTTAAPIPIIPSQLKAVPGIPGVYDLEIVITEDTNRPSPYQNFINFLSALEKNRRTAEVSSINITPNPTNRNLVSFTLTLEDYIKP